MPSYRGRGGRGGGRGRSVPHAMGPQPHYYQPTGTGPQLGGAGPLHHMTWAANMNANIAHAHHLSTNQWENTTTLAATGDEAGTVDVYERTIPAPPHSSVRYQSHYLPAVFQNRWRDKVRADTLIDRIRNLPVGYGYSGEHPAGNQSNGLRGYTLGVLLSLLTMANVPLHGLYIVGSFRILDIHPTTGAATGSRYLTAAFQNTHLHLFPLWLVHSEITFDRYHQSPDRYELGMFTSLALEQGAGGPPGSETDGSDMTAWILWDDVRIVRKTEPPPAWIQKRVRAIRTGGLPQIIVQSIPGEEIAFPFLLVSMEEGRRGPGVLDKMVVQISPENIVPYQIHMPNGVGNCFEKTIKWCYMHSLDHDFSVGAMRTKEDRITQHLDQHFRGKVDALMHGKRYRHLPTERRRIRFEKEIRRRTALGYSDREIKTLIEFFLLRNIWIHVFYIGKPGGERKGLKDLSHSMAKKFSNELREGCFLSLFVFQMNDRGEIHNVNRQLTKYGLELNSAASATMTTPHPGEAEENQEDVMMMLMEETTTTTTTTTTNTVATTTVATSIEDPTSASQIIHCLGVISFSNKGLLSRADPLALISEKDFTRNRFAFLVDYTRYSLPIESITKPFMEEMFRKAKYDDRIDNDTLRDLVAYQLQRYSLKQVRTLIFDHAAGGDPTPLPSDDDDNDDVPPPPTPRTTTTRSVGGGGMSYQTMQKLANSKAVVVFAYDLESVINDSSVQEWVGERFQTYLTEHTRQVPARGGGGGGDGSENENENENEERPYEKYQPAFTQIPFSAQCVPVNCSIYGQRYISRKKKAGVELPDEEKHVARVCQSEAWCNTPLFDEEDGNGGGDGPTKKAHVLLHEVETFYGNDRLGDCVDEMLCYMAQFAYANHYGMVYAFAHNGVGFDSYLVIHHTSFPIIRLLKTPRGLLSVSIKVPANPSTNEFVTVVLRDTKVWLNQSLASICQDFKVPPSWCKTDFPITMVRGNYCYHPDIKTISKEYGENDVRALAFILNRLNWVIGESPWDPADVYTKRPPITLFCTLMSMVKKCTKNHFLSQNIPLSAQPQAVDVPALRTWIKRATIGGRVVPFAKGYVSPAWKIILDTYLLNDDSKEKLRELYHTRVYNPEGGRFESAVLLDVTSLYPTAMSQCSMPTGLLSSIDSIDHCKTLIDAIACTDCESLFRICDHHQTTPRPFAIILVKDFCFDLATASRDDDDDGNGSFIHRRHPFMPLCGRKLEGKRGVVYSFESDDEVREGYAACHPQSPAGTDFLPLIQSYSNVDLYWFRKLGWTFQIIGGFMWQTDFTYKTFIDSAFEMRKKAKKEGNKVMSAYIKLNVNGSFGVTAQQDILSSTFALDMPPALQNKSFLHPDVLNYLYNTKKKLGPDEEIEQSYPLPTNGQTLFKKVKSSRLAEFYVAQSPLQIGVAVLSWSRHIMNLLMFHAPTMYTDTDSLAITSQDLHLLELQDPHHRLIDHSPSSALGTYKNDHEEKGGPGARIVFAGFGAKKVKIVITLNRDGELTIHNTFKGMNPVRLDADDRCPLQNEDVVYPTSKALLEIYYDGIHQPVACTQWARSLNNGISIYDFDQTPDPKTYLAHAIGTSFELLDTLVPPVPPNPYHGIEWFVPKGMQPLIKPTFAFGLITDPRTFPPPFPPPPGTNPLQPYYGIIHRRTRIRGAHIPPREKMIHLQQKYYKVPFSPYFHQRNARYEATNQPFLHALETIRRVRQEVEVGSG